MESGTRAAAVAKQTPRRSRSRWDETPQIRAGGDPSATPVWTGGETPVIAAGAETPKIAAGMAAPSAAQIAAHQAMQSNVPLTPEQYQQMRYQREIEERNRPQTDEELDELLPSEGFKIIDPPGELRAIRTQRASSCRRRCRMAPTQVSFQFQRRTAGKSLTSVSHQKVYPR